MTMKLTSLLIFLGILSITDVLAISPEIESLVVRNFSSEEIVIEREFIDDSGNVHSNFMWMQNIEGIDVIIKDYLSIVNRSKLPPYTSLTIVEYFPSAPIEELDEMYERLAETPFITKMNYIFKTLSIKFSENEEYINLNALKDVTIKRRVSSGETTFILDIFDINLIGRPGSEW